LLSFFGATVKSPGDGSCSSSCPCFLSPCFVFSSSSSLSSASEGMFEQATERRDGWAYLPGGLGAFGVGWMVLVDLLQLLLSSCLVLLPPPPFPVGNLSQAVENVLSVLLFYPEDEAAKSALTQYQAELGEPRPGLGPREVTSSPHLPLG
jgi:hypothetical protein